MSEAMERITATLTGVAHEPHKYGGDVADAVVGLAERHEMFRNDGLELAEKCDHYRHAIEDALKMLEPGDDLSPQPDVAAAILRGGLARESA